MEVILKQGVFRFILLSRVNELMQHRELVISSIKDSLVSKLTPKTSSEVDSGQSVNTNPKLVKEVDEILSDLNVFALTGGDSERRAGSESTTVSEISSNNYVANLVSNTIVLKSILGFLSGDINDTTAADLQISFNSYLDISREIASWTMYLNQMQNDTTVKMGASSLSLLMKNWGPVGLSEDIDDKYNRLYDHIYFLSLSGKVKALLDSNPVGIKIKQVEKEYTFSESGVVKISLPPGAQLNYIDFLCKVDYVIRTSKSDSYMDLDYDVSYDFGANVFSISITEVDGATICEVSEPIDPLTPNDVPRLPPPPIMPPLPIPPVPDPPSGCLPLALSFVIDFSGSMVDYAKYDVSKGIIQWIDRIMKNSSQEGVDYSDYASIVKFSGIENRNNINIVQALTSTKSLLRQAVQDPYTSFDKTPIWDACMISLRALKDQVADIPNFALYNSVLILLTDGVDNLSTYTPADVISYANDNNILIYTIGMKNRFQGHLFWDPNHISIIATDTGGEFRELDRETFTLSCDVCDNTCYNEVCTSCDNVCYNEGCTLCNQTCHGQGCTSCHNEHYEKTCNTCDTACNQECCYYCDNTSYNTCTSCHYTCYTDTTCATCDMTCYSERCSYCDNTCYADRAGCLSCDNRCYSERCGTCYSCYTQTVCTLCNNTCYGDNCDCDSTCYGYSHCATCDVACYQDVDGYCFQEQDSEGYCTCNNTCYSQGYCTCNNTCYNQGCSECHREVYGDQKCSYCDNTCYGYRDGCSRCDDKCYAEKCTSCNNARYGQECTLCHSTCYQEQCVCYSSCYGEHCTTCDHSCYGECTVCDNLCYAESCNTCDSTCYEGNVCNICDSKCYFERCISCHNACYDAHTSTDVFEAYNESIESACDVVTINSSKTTADFTADVVEGYNPLTVTFSDASLGTIIGRAWSFGNGDTSTLTSPASVTYDDPGVYTVRLKTAGTQTEYNDEETKKEYIRVWETQALPVAAFQADRVKGGKPFLVNFTDQTINYYASRKFDFGDGAVQVDADAIAVGRQISHAYLAVGVYTVTLTVYCPQGSSTITRTEYIEAVDCFSLAEGNLKVGYTLIEKYDIPDRQGVIYYQLDFKVNNWTVECMPDCVNLFAINPEGIIPVAIVDLKYTNISGSGADNIPIKIGQSVPWSPSGFLRGEITYTRNGETKVNVSFRAKTTFPDPGDVTKITALEIGDYTFTNDTNILGIEDTNSIIRLIKFEIPDGNTSADYTVGEVSNIINNVFDGEVIALPNEFGRLVLFTKRGEYLRVVGIDQGSTANSVFGFYEYGEINTPDLESEVSYVVTLYLIGVLEGNTIDTSLSTTLKDYTEHKIVHGTMEFNSYNWYKDRYGKIPSEIGASLFVTPGHKILGMGLMTLSKIESFKDLIYSDDEKGISSDGVMPYWEDMKVGSIYNDTELNVWNVGDDKRFFTRTFLDLSDSIYCIMGNYNFMAPGPVLPYQITANIEGPYDLGDANSCTKVCYPGSSESRNRFLAIRKVALDGTSGTEWYFVELPFGLLTVDELISTMQRNDYRVVNSVNMYSPINITMTTALLDINGYLVIGRNDGASTTDIRFEAVDDKLRISIPDNQIYGIRLGGSPELVFANKIFGWNTLGELGDPVRDGFYYKYTYEVDAYTSKSPHPSSSYKQTLIPEIGGVDRNKYTIYNGPLDLTPLAATEYKVVLNAASVDKAGKILSVYLNLLATVYDPKLICDYGPLDPPPIDDDEWPYKIEPCLPVTFSELTVNIPCDVNIICDQEWPFLEISDLITQITDDPILNEFGLSMQLGNPNDITYGKDRLLTALDNLLNNDYINDPTTTSGSGFNIEAVANVTDLTEFSKTGLLPYINTLITNIHSKWATDYFGLIKDIAQFVISYITLYNQDGTTLGVKFKIPIVSTIYLNCTTVTIAKYSLLDYAVSAINAIFKCQFTKKFTCVSDKIVFAYPLAINTLDGSEHTPDTIKIEYCSCNLNEELQITVTMDPIINSSLKGVVCEKSTDKLIAMEFPYYEFEISGDPFDSTGEVTPENIYEVILPEDSIPMYIEINDEIQTGTSSLIKETTWHPKLHKLDIILCGITENSLVLEVEDCIILTGSEVYIFNSNIHDNDITLDLSGRSKIMLDDLLVLVQTTFQSLTVTLSEDETKITIEGNSVVLNVVSKPSIDPLNVYVTYDEIDYDLDIKIYFGYFNISDTVSIASVAPATQYPLLTYEPDSGE